MHRFSPYKIMHHLDRVSRSLADPLTPPMHVQLDLSENCNHNCVFCFFREDAFNTGMKRENIAKGKGRRSIRTEPLLQVISQLGRSGTKAITIVGGGEPLLHPDVEAVLEAIVLSGMQYGVITNGSVGMQGKTLQWLNRAAWIRVSLDAATPEVYARMHQPKNGHADAFNRTLENLKRLRVHCPDTDIGASFLIHPFNHREIASAAALCRELGLNYIQYKPVYTEARGEDIRPFLPDISVQLEEASRSQNHRFQVISLLSRIDDIAKPSRSYRHCKVHLLNTQIGVDGKVYPCCVLKYVEKYSFGSIYEHSFAEVWTGQKRLEIVKSLDSASCPPCWYDRTNEVLDYLSMSRTKHEAFV
jgi:radical SAM protein with 4Fe4S-binding SPASM domain